MRQDFQWTAEDKFQIYLLYVRTPRHLSEMCLYIRYQEESLVLGCKVILKAALWYRNGAKT